MCGGDVHAPKELFVQVVESRVNIFELILVLFNLRFKFLKPGVVNALTLIVGRAGEVGRRCTYGGVVLSGFRMCGGCGIWKVGWSGGALDDCRILSYSGDCSGLGGRHLSSMVVDDRLVLFKVSWWWGLFRVGGFSYRLRGGFPYLCRGERV